MRYIIFFCCLSIGLMGLSCAVPKTGSKQVLRSKSGQQVVGETGVASKSLTSAAVTEEYVADEVLVRFREGTDQRTIEAINDRVGLRIVGLVANQIYVMKIRSDASVEGVIKQLQQIPQVSLAEPNYIRKSIEKPRGK